MLHLSDCVAPGAAAATSARISRNGARAIFGAAEMYSETVVGRLPLAALTRDSGPAGVRIGRRVEVLALGGELLDEPLQLRHAPLGGADGHAVLATRIAAGLARVQPVLDRPGQQAVGDVP